MNNHTKRELFCKRNVLIKRKVLPLICWQFISSGPSSLYRECGNPRERQLGGGGKDKGAGDKNSFFYGEIIGRGSYSKKKKFADCYTRKRKKRSERSRQSYFGREKPKNPMPGGKVDCLKNMRQCVESRATLRSNLGVSYSKTKRFWGRMKHDRRIGRTQKKHPFWLEVQSLEEGEQAPQFKKKITDTYEKSGKVLSEEAGKNW